MFIKENQQCVFRQPSYMGVELHQDQELVLPVSCRPLVGTQEAGDVLVLLEQRQAVDGALVGEVLPVGRAEDFNGHEALLQRATEHGAVTASTNQLPETTTERLVKRSAEKDASIGPGRESGPSQLLTGLKFKIACILF